MRHIKLFEGFILEAYHSNPIYDRILDIYNYFGIKGMSPKEIDYLKSGGESQEPTFMLNEENRKLISKLSSYIPKLDQKKIKELSDQEFLLYLALNSSYSDPEKSKPIIIDFSMLGLHELNFYDDPYNLSNLLSGLSVLNINLLSADSIYDLDLPEDNGEEGKGGVLHLKYSERANKQVLSKIIQLAKTRKINEYLPSKYYTLPNKWIIVFTCIKYMDELSKIDSNYIPLEKFPFEPRKSNITFLGGNRGRNDDGDADIDHGEEWKK